MLNVHNLTVSFMGTDLFSGITFKLNKGDRIGLIGKNGAGKSTLLKVLSKDNKKIGQITSGIFSPRIKKNIGLSMILKDHWEIGENVFVETLNGDKRNGTITSLPFTD